MEIKEGRKEYGREGKGRGRERRGEKEDRPRVWEEWRRRAIAGHWVRRERRCIWYFWVAERLDHDAPACSPGLTDSGCNSSYTSAKYHTNRMPVSF